MFYIITNPNLFQLTLCKNFIFIFKCFNIDAFTKYDIIIQYTYYLGGSAMRFKEKLDFLMNVASISKIRLSSETSIDASIINRLLDEDAPPLKNKKSIMIISSFLAENIIKDSQKNSVCKVLSIDLAAFPDTKEKMTSLLFDWLCPPDTNNKSDNNFLTSLIQDELINNPNKIDKDFFDAQYLSNVETINASAFRGIKGRQNAYTLFLSYVLKSDTPRTLYLSSDDDFSWLLSNPKFTNLSIDLTNQIIKKGNKILIIHDVKRTFYDMFHTIDIWFPLYASGLVIPYYYPNKRDDVFKRTLFLASETAAIVSTTISENCDNKIDFFFTDKNIISDFAKEAKDYLSLCKPLLKIYTNKNIDELYKAIDETDSLPQNCIFKPCNLSMSTINEDLLSKFFNRMNLSTHQKNIFIEYSFIKYKNFIKSFEHNITKDVITLPDIKDVIEKKVKVPSHNPLEKDHIYYTPLEFIEHLENIIKLLEKYKNYDVTIQQQDIMPNCSIIIRQNVGMIFIKKTPEPFVFSLSEPTFTDSFWDYMYIRSDPFEDNEKKRKKVISKLKSYITQLKKYL